MILNSQDLETVRQHPQSSDLYLSIFRPNTVMSAFISGTVIENGTMTIPYYGASGSYLSIEPGMTVLVGNSVGGMEVGKIRLRSATGTYISVAENSFNWNQATNISILRYWEMWPIYPRIIANPSVDTDVIFYKDYDIPYSNQNSVLGTFPCAGTHRAGWVGDSFYYSSTGTSHLLGSALTYDWAFEGGTPTGSTSATPGNVQYNTAGHFVTRLTVTGANGSVDTTYRYVSIYNKTENSSQNNTIKKWELGELHGSRSEGGYTASITVIDEILPNIREGDVVVIFSNDWYGGTNSSFGGNSPSNSTIFFVGHIQNGSIQYDYQSSRTSFSVSSVTDVMKETEGYAISVESKASPAKWFELLDMTTKRAVYHFLKWHSTALLFNDLEYKGVEPPHQYFDSERASIFDGVNGFMQSAVLGDMCADRQGKLWVEVGTQYYTNPTGSFLPVQSITSRDWLGAPSITEQAIATVSSMELGGVAYSGAVTGTFSALLCAVPGNAPNFRGTVENIEGLVLASQQELNTIAGNVFAKKNAVYPTIDMDLSGNYRQFDIAPIESVDINILPTDTNRGVGIHAPYLVDSMGWNYKPDVKVLLPSTGLLALVNGNMGITVTIPDVPDGGGFGGFGGGFNFNPGAIPPFAGDFVSSLVVLKYWQATSDATPPVGAGSHNFGTVSAPPSYYTLRFTNDLTFIAINANGYPSVTKSGFYLLSADYAIEQSTTFTEMAVGIAIPSQVLLNDFDRSVLPIPGLSLDTTTYAQKVMVAYLSAGDYIVPFIIYTGSTGVDLVQLLINVVKIG